MEGSERKRESFHTRYARLPGLHHKTREDHGIEGPVQDVQVQIYSDGADAFILGVEHAGLTIHVQTRRDGIVGLRDICMDALGRT